MVRLLLVCAGGAFGSGARYLVSTWAVRALGPAFPFGTLIVNASGSFLLAVIMGVAGPRDPLTPEVRLLLGAGVMGGYTTYSSFNWETLALAQRGSLSLALANVSLTVVVCLVAGVLGLFLARLLAG